MVHEKVIYPLPAFQMTSACAAIQITEKNWQIVNKLAYRQEKDRDQILSFLVEIGLLTFIEHYPLIQSELNL